MGELVVCTVCDGNVSVVGATVRVGVVAVPVPESATACGLPVALSAMLTLAVRAPPAVGLNVTLMMQFASTARLAGQVFVWEKSPAFAPVKLTPVIVSAALPLFVSVTDCGALDVPTFCDANVRLVGASVTVGAFAGAPVPVRLTLCGLPVALSVILTLAERAPVAVGLNVTLIVQFAFAARLAGQVLVSVKSLAFAPAIVMLVIVSAALPEFVSVTACGALDVPTFCDANVRAVGASITAGAFAAVPVPVRGTDCGLPVALSATLTFAVRAPVAVGLNVTLIVQFAFAARLAGHVLVCEKSPGFAPVIETLVIVRAAVPVLARVIA